ncbi:MAG: HypC/HybG/HupF family hydrogenase formation chaperone [Candidatus Nanopelagicales bacterium]|nr:HypC/HybG/HupF family hydrogenase formation chaperone [Candidatus Nanopelagicales bacterium]
MCLGIPGRILEVEGAEEFRTASVDFGGVRRQVCLAFVPEAEVGEYVIVHVGFAISRVDEAEAIQTLAIIQEMSDLYEQELAATAEPKHDPVLGSPL